MDIKVVCENREIDVEECKYCVIQVSPHCTIVVQHEHVTMCVKVVPDQNLIFKSPINSWIAGILK